ncbi:MAG TPA: hypothetical protein VI199_15000 [Novosphingobium sp.]
MHECILTCKRFLKGGAKTASHQDAIDKGFEASPTSSACSWAEAPVAIEQFTHELIDRAIEKGKIDLLVDVVNPVPSLLTMHLLGLPLDEWQRFTMPMHEKNYAIPGSESAARARRGVEWFLRYVREQIAVQRKYPRPGLISYLMDADAIGERRGRPADAGPIPDGHSLRGIHALHLAGARTGPDRRSRHRTWGPADQGRRTHPVPLRLGQP